METKNDLNSSKAGFFAFSCETMYYFAVHHHKTKKKVLNKQTMSQLHFKGGVSQSQFQNKQI